LVIIITLPSHTLSNMMSEGKFISNIISSNELDAFSEVQTKKEVDTYNQLIKVFL
jgi:hypothetical protein